MVAVFYCLFILGAGYFLAARRRPDAFTLGFFSAALYFLPGFVGHVPDLANQWASDHVPIHASVYAIYSVVFLAILGLGLAWDWRPRDMPPLPRLPGEHTRIADAVVLGVLVCLAAAPLGQYEATVLSPDKHRVMADLPQMHKFLTMYAGFAALFFALKRQWLMVLLCVLPLFWDLYIGFRVRIGWLFIGALLVYFHALGPRRLVAHWRSGLVVALAGLSFFVYKPIYQWIKQGYLWGVLERLGTPGTYARAIEKSEPFNVQASLNRIVRTGFEVPPENLVSQFLVMVPFGRSAGGIEIDTFNAYFQPALFPDLSFGLAANWWAQWYAALGWGGVMLGLLVFLVPFVVVNWLLQSPSKMVTAGGGLLAAIMVFYIHRNDVLFTYGHAKEMVAMVAVSALLTAVMAHLTRGRRGILCGERRLDERVTHTEGVGGGRGGD